MSTAHASIQFAFLVLPSKAYMPLGIGVQALQSTLDKDRLHMYPPRSESNAAIDDNWLTHAKQREDALAILVCKIFIIFNIPASEIFRLLSPSPSPP